MKKSWIAGPSSSNPSLASRVRGLVLGLALGDAIGSCNGAPPDEGVLKAGVASQLAAWSIEGTLRNLTRYGKLQPWLTDVGRYAYQRWGLLRGIEPATDGNWHPHLVVGVGRDDALRGGSLTIP